MAVFGISGISVRGISASVPITTEDNETLDLIPERERKTFVEQTGIRYRRVAPAGTTASDLCMAAARPLIEKLKWSPADIDILVFISQTPDYLIPNTASVIHQRLGLAKKCIAFDINLGCSGYVYGLSVLASLLQHIPGGKGLLLVGDCSTSVISREDKSTWPLFSDAGSATAVEQNSNTRQSAAQIPDEGFNSLPEPNAWHFNLQSDGAGYQDIMIKGGGHRHPFSADSLDMQEYGPGIRRNDLQMKLDGIHVFHFSLREIMPNIQALLSAIHVSQSEIDFFILHQGNKLMLESIRKKMKEPVDKFPYSLFHFGNTSSASIPVTIVTQLQARLTDAVSRLLMCGFGVGLSWGSVYLKLDNPLILPLIEI